MNAIYKALADFQVELVKLQKWVQDKGLRVVVIFEGRDKTAHQRSNPTLEDQPMDLKSRAKWVEYSRAKDKMFEHTDIKQAPWFVVRADDKKRARLNVIAHLLGQIPYDELEDPKIKLPRRQKNVGYVRPRCRTKRSCRKCSRLGFG